MVGSSSSAKEPHTAVPWRTKWLRQQRPPRMNPSPTRSWSSSLWSGERTSTCRTNRPSATTHGVGSPASTPRSGALTFERLSSPHFLLLGRGEVLPQPISGRLLLNDWQGRAHIGSLWPLYHGDIAAPMQSEIASSAQRPCFSPPSVPRPKPSGASDWWTHRSMMRRLSKCARQSRSLPSSCLLSRFGPGSSVSVGEPSIAEVRHHSVTDEFLCCGRHSSAFPARAKPFFACADDSPGLADLIPKAYCPFSLKDHGCSLELRSCEILSSSCEVLNGFATKRTCARAPPSSSRQELPEIKITGRDGRLARSRRANSGPSISGILTSVSRRSTPRSWSNRAQAEAAEDAARTRKPLVESIRWRKLRTVSSSSTTRMVWAMTNYLRVLRRASIFGKCCCR